MVAIIETATRAASQTKQHIWVFSFLLALRSSHHYCKLQSTNGKAPHLVYVHTRINNCSSFAYYSEHEMLASIVTWWLST